MRSQESPKRKKRICISVAAVCALTAGFCTFALIVPPKTWKYSVGLPDICARKAGELRIHFLSVGQGDCEIIEFPDGRSMVIDGGDGEEEHTLAMIRYLNALNISRPDFLLLTHSDSDHCGGLDTLLSIKGAGTVYRPYLENPAINDEYASFYSALEQIDCNAIFSKRYLQISSLVESYPYTLTFLSPYGEENPSSPYRTVNSGTYTDQDLNDTSAVVWLDYNGVSALFTGDATERTEELLMRDYSLGFFENYGVKLDSTEILKVAHHGSRYSTSEKFTRFLGVKTAAISCGKNNLYGHPSVDVCDHLSAVGAEIYRTDLQGNIVVTIFADGSYGTTAHIE